MVVFNSANCQLWYLTRGMPAQDERAWGVDTDTLGNIFWAVEQKDQWPNWYYNIFLYKIDPDGRQLFQGPSWGGAFNDIAFVTKVSGPSVFLAGRIDSTINPSLGDALVVSFRTNDGAYNWHYAYDQESGYEEIDGISIQNDGIYLTGWTQNKQSQIDFLVQKISHAGKLIWSNSWDYNDLGKEDGANGQMAIDTRYIYAAGHVNRTNLASFDGDMGLACFNRTDGSLKWKTTWGGLLYDDGLGLTMGTDSMLYVVGYTGSYGKGSQSYLNKYSRAGQLQWSRIWGGAWAEDSRAVAAGRDSLVYVVGATSSYGHGDYDIFVLKYSASGILMDSLIWGGIRKETAHDAVLHGDFLYITGETWSYGQGAAAGNGHSEGLLLKVNVSTMEGPDSSMTAIREIPLDGEGIRIFPNPAGSRVTIEFPDPATHNLTIYDLSGRPVLQIENIHGGPFTLQTGNLPAGIYLIYASTSAGRTYTQKIMIDH